MRIGWMLGWAVPEAWFGALARGALPGAEHRCFAAEPGGVARLLGEGPFDWAGGYSLGALLLLSEREALSAAGCRVALLAPIFAFPKEAGLGGRVARAQVRHLGRWLRREPAAALADFHRRAGLDVPEGSALAPPETLAWGLERLAGEGVEPALPPGWRAWCGSADPLLDAGRLRTLAPGLEIVPGATHHPGALLGALAREIAAERGGSP